MAYQNRSSRWDPTQLHGIDWWLGHHNHGWFNDVSNFSAGVGDRVSGGLTARARRALGYDDVVNYNSGSYRTGGYAGDVINIGLMFTPAGYASRAGMTLTAVQLTGNAVNTGEALARGNYGQAAIGIAGMAMPLLRGRNPCLAGIGMRGLTALNSGMAFGEAVNRYEAGDPIGAVLSAIQGMVGLRQATQQCFPEGTLVICVGVETDEELKPIVLAPIVNAVVFLGLGVLGCLHLLNLRKNEDEEKE